MGEESRLKTLFENPEVYDSHFRTIIALQIDPSRYSKALDNYLDDYLKKQREEKEEGGERGNADGKKKQTESPVCRICNRVVNADVLRRELDLFMEGEDFPLQTCIACGLRDYSSSQPFQPFPKKTKKRTLSEFQAIHFNDRPKGIRKGYEVMINLQDGFGNSPLGFPVSNLTLGWY